MAQVMLNVNDLKQYFYCPRIIYYNWVIPVTPPSTYLMQRGTNLEAEFERLEPRRTLTKYGFETAERLFNITLTNYELGLTGKADLILKSNDRVAVVDLKASPVTYIALNRKVQIVAYMLLAEFFYKLPCQIGFIALLDSNLLEPITLDDNLRALVDQTITSIRQIILNQELPDATNNRNKCSDCEYRNYCGDVF